MNSEKFALCSTMFLKNYYLKYKLIETLNPNTCKCYFFRFPSPVFGFEMNDIFVIKLSVHLVSVSFYRWLLTINLFIILKKVISHKNGIPNRKILFSRT